MLTKKSYPYKHWLTSIALTPILVIVDDTILLDWVRLVNHLQSYPVFFILGVAFSLPTFIIYLLLFTYLEKLEKPEPFIKITLILFTLISILITFKIIGGSAEKELMVMYSVSSIISSFFFKINPHQTITHKLPMS